MIRSRCRLFIAAIGLACLAGAGCATAPRPVEAETVGQLSESSTHVYSAPVHAATDLTPAAGAVDTDDDAAKPTASSLDVLNKEAAASGDVALAPKEAHGF